MNKSLRIIVIIIGVASILFSLYGVIKGRGVTDAIGGITIGICLIGAIYFEKNKS